MREIKFRGQRIDNNECIYGYYVKDPKGQHRIYCKPFDEASSNTYHFVKEESVGQYIGLKDKNGKEIYESDIVNQEIWISVGKYERAIGVVKYRIVGFTCECVGDYIGSNAKVNSNAIVIGNIYENPELLKQ